MLNHLRSRAHLVDPGLMLAILLSLIAAWPFLLRPSLPRETDAELHVFRAAEVGYLLRAGEWYPRWAPDFYYGYGYPIFNYYAPLTYYLANLLTLSIPGGAVWGMKAVAVLGFLCAGCGAYGLGQQLAGRRAGVIVAACYLFAPYIYLIDPHLRGDLAEFFALGLMPLALWALAAYQQQQTRLWLAASALLCAAAILTHNLLGLVTFGMLVAYMAWSSFLARPSHTSPIRALVSGVLPLILGLGMAAFFWLPVMLEADEVKLSNLIGPGHFDYRNHFVAPRELLSPSLPLDLGAVNPAFRFNLGLGTWLVGLLGCAGLAVARRERSKPTQNRGGPSGIQTAHPWSHALFWPACGLVLIFLMTRASQFIWDTVPPMPFFQFPWRFLGPASLCIAITGGYSVSLLRFINPKWDGVALAALVLAPMMAALPIFIPPTWGSFGPADLQAMLNFELNGLALGTTSTGDFLPRTVDVVPGPAPSLIESYREGSVLDRVNRATVPPGASVVILTQRPTLDEFLVSSNDDFVLRLYRFMFAGWRATVDGQPVAIEVAQPEGFITVRVPPGEHVVRVWLGLTPARAVASAISACALGLLVVLTMRTPVGARPTPHPWTWSETATLVAIALFVCVAVGGGALGCFQPHSTGIIALPAQVDIHHFFQGGIDLIGYDLGPDPIRPGDTITLTLYWKSREPVPANYQVFVHLTTLPQHTWGQSDKLNPGDYPTTRWPQDRYVLDRHTLTIPPGTPPGEYTLRVGLWDHTTGVRQLVVATDGTILGDSVELPDRIRIVPVDHPPEVSELPLDLVIQETVSEGIDLLGAEVEPSGDFTTEMGQLTIVLYWRARQSDLLDYRVALRLIDDHGRVITRMDSVPADGLRPTTLWERGEVVRDVHSLWIDTSIPAGGYQIQVGLLPAPSSQPDRWVSVSAFGRTLP